MAKLLKHCSLAELQVEYRKLIQTPVYDEIAKSNQHNKLAYIEELISNKENEKIHTTIGVYTNGDMKLNGVCESNLNGHIEYNKNYRWGRALFVDGSCVHKGYLNDEKISEYEKLFKSDSKYTIRKNTAPYN